ncbi:hypothetical protein [Rhizobium tubonense]|uniref:Uncharacterized protein n=1 Tax=Rhizobium tubonense TaxID=484088 RepID=A0A2W4CKT2_9HYPH|nr:hypothetical protein [Rhizobium tubonense]PZM11558.1 hypothetical protein CPY51_20235 [Rhizobium tubonense]
MSDQSALYHASVYNHGIRIEDGVFTFPKLKAVILSTAPKTRKVTPGDILRAVTDRDGTFEMDGWRIKTSKISQTDRL